MLYICYIYAIYMLYICYIYAIYMLYICCIYAVYINMNVSSISELWSMTFVVSFKILPPPVLQKTSSCSSSFSSAKYLLSSSQLREGDLFLVTSRT